jgi:hypothetical protein
MKKMTDNQQTSIDWSKLKCTNWLNSKNQIINYEFQRVYQK